MVKQSTAETASPYSHPCPEKVPEGSSFLNLFKQQQSAAQLMNYSRRTLNISDKNIVQFIVSLIQTEEGWCGAEVEGVYV